VALDGIHIRLLGFAGFDASEHFLRGLAEEIWVARWGRSPKIRVHLPDSLDTAEAMRNELQQPSLITIVSAHAGYFSGSLCLCGEDDQPCLPVSSVRRLGATSMVMIDACCTSDLAVALKKACQPGSLLVGLNNGPGQYTRGRDSVAVLGSVIRELSYPARVQLDDEGVRRAVESVNAQIKARNQAERERGVTSEEAFRPLIKIFE
jgi:hypothetical protein